MSQPQQHRSKKPRSVFTIACGVFTCLAFIMLMILGVIIASRVGETREVIRYVNSDPLIISVPTIEEEKELPATPAQPRSVEQLLQDYSESHTIVDYTLQTEPKANLPLDQVQKSNPKINDPLIEKLIEEVQEAHLQGDLMAALLKLEEAKAQKTPTEPAVFFHMALLFEDMGHWEKATQNYEKLFLMGPSIGNYYHQASSKLSHGIKPEINKHIPAHIGKVLKRESDDNLNVHLTIPVLSQADAHFHPKNLELKVHHYDLVDNQRIEPVPPSHGENIHTRWKAENPNWDSQKEIAESHYHLPTLTKADAHLFGVRKYFGYVIELYYKNELIDQHAHPRRLHAKHAQFQLSPQYHFPIQDMLYQENSDTPLLPSLPVN